MSALATVAADFRKAMRALADAEFAAEVTAGDVLVATTYSTRTYRDDMIVIGPVSTTQEPVTTNRGREVTLEVQVEFHALRRGEDDADEAAFDRVVELASRVSERVRRAAPAGDTTLASVVRDCAEVAFDADHGEAQMGTGTGRLWVAIAVYRAHARLRG